MLAHERHGHGEPLVLLHGIGHRRQAWDPVLDLLAEHHEVVTVDLPGHGDSPAFPSRSRDPKTVLREEFEELFAYLELGRPHVVGNSLGGLIALELAVDRLAGSVIALSPAGFWHGSADFTYVRGFFVGMLVSAGLTRPVADRLLTTTLGRRLMLSWLVAHPERIDPAAAVEDFHALLATRHTVRHLLARGYTFQPPVPLRAPVTVAWAEHDWVLPTYQARVAERRLPDATHLTLTGCGHVPMSDDPELVASTILAHTHRAGRDVARTTARADQGPQVNKR